MRKKLHYCNSSKQVVCNRNGMTAPNDRVCSFAYNAVGQRTQYAHQNGTRTEYAYDTWNRMTGRKSEGQSRLASLAWYSPCFSYDDHNQMTVVPNVELTWNNTYDDWGRLISSAATSGGNTYTRTYTYWFGDKLKQVTSNAPGETPQVGYLYDGLGKRRWRVAGTDTTYWRWDAGYSVLTQYDGGASDWDFGDLKRCATPVSHPTAEAFRKRLLGKEKNRCFAFLRHEGLPPTNNHAEQSIRPVVIMRKTSFGPRSPRGSQRLGILQSLAQTAK